MLGARPRAWAAALVVVAVATAVTFGAGTRPSFDAYGWLTWGRMTLHGGLDTNAAPSFKPLPYVFTVVFGLFGRAAAWRLWMVASIAVSLAGLGAAGALAWTLSGARRPRSRPGAGRGSAGTVAGVVAALLAVTGVLCLSDEFRDGYLHYVLSAQSDPMVVAAVLGAACAWWRGGTRATVALLWLAALGRPEAWPLLAAGGWWLWRARPGSRPWVLLGAAAVGLLWFGIPALSSRSWFVAGDNALRAGGAPTGNRALGTLGRFTGQLPWPLGVAGAIAGVAALGAWTARRSRTAGPGTAAARGTADVTRLAAGLAGATVLWVGIEVAFALHGWPAYGRFMFEPAAATIVLGAGFGGRLVGWAAGSAGDRDPETGPSAAGGLWRPSSAVTRELAGVLAAALLVATIAVAIPRARSARADLIAQHVRTRSLDALTARIARAGGAGRIRGCGEAISQGLATQTVLAYDLGENVSAVGFEWPQPRRADNPVVVFTPRGTSWRIRGHRQRAAQCRDLGATGAG